MKLKTGDRVAAYYWDDDDRTATRIVGTVFKSNKTETHIKDDNGVGLMFCTKQCRRLVKKPRRRVWVSPATLEKILESNSYSAAYYNNELLISRAPFDGSVEFIEVRKPKGEK